MNSFPTIVEKTRGPEQTAIYCAGPADNIHGFGSKIFEAKEFVSLEEWIVRIEAGVEFNIFMILNLLLKSLHISK